MAVTILSTNVAEKYQKQAMVGNIALDPIPRGIGCLSEANFDTIDAGSVSIFYEPALAAADPTSAPADYNLEGASNSLVTIPFNNYFVSAIKMYNAQLNAVPYKMAAIKLDQVLKKDSNSKGRSEIACLINESNTQETAPATPEALAEAVLAARAKISSSGNAANIVLCSPEFMAKVILAAGAAFRTERANQIWTSATTAGEYLGLYWVETSMLGADATDTYKYNDSTGASKTATPSEVDYIMWDGSKFASIQRVNEFGLKDGGAIFSGVAAVSDNVMGVKVLDPKAVVVGKK